jgi:hypothetical protein
MNDHEREIQARYDGLTPEKQSAVTRAVEEHFRNTPPEKVVENVKRIIMSNGHHSDEVDRLYEAMTIRTSNLLDVEKAARDLYRKLLVVHADDQYQGVWALHMIHGGKYTGPNYGPEMEALRMALGEEKKP